jgi:hypothetical protein
MAGVSVMRSRAVQVDPSELPSDGVSGRGMGEPSGPKVYFRIHFGDKSLQFKLCSDSCFRVLFSKMDVVGSFVWHGVALDAELTPRQYNMKPGEENCVSVNVVRDASREHTYAKEIELNDVARAHAYQRRVAEERASRLEAELDQSQAQIYALHSELRQLTEQSTKALHRERSRNAELEQRVDSLQQTVEHLQLQQQRLTSMHSASAAAAAMSPPRYMQATKSSSLAANSTTGASPLPKGRHPFTQPLEVALKPADPTRRLQAELEAWQSSVLFSAAREGAPGTAREVSLSTQLSSRQSDADRPFGSARDTPRQGDLEKVSKITVHVTYVDEQQQMERNLGHIVAPCTTRSNAVSLASLLHLVKLPVDVDCSLMDCTLCLFRTATSEHEVVPPTDAHRVYVFNDDTLFLARIDPLAT